jgi:chromate transport protein ChrA
VLGFLLQDSIETIEERRPPREHFVVVTGSAEATAPIRCSFRQTPTRCRVGVGGSVVSSASRRMQAVPSIVTYLVSQRLHSASIACREDFAMEGESASRRVSLRDLVRYFLRLGLLGFGGPVALQMERELVGDKKWLTKDEMREGIAVCQSLRGPVKAIFYGVSPAVIALILHSCYRLTKLGMKDWIEWTLAAAAFVITVAVQAEVALVFIGCGIVGLLYYGSLFRARASTSTTRIFVFGVPLAVAGAALSSIGKLLGELLVFFLKAGSLTFGSGLVIVPSLEKGLVRWNDGFQHDGANPGQCVSSSFDPGFRTDCMFTGPSKLHR